MKTDCPIGTSHKRIGFVDHNLENVHANVYLKIP